MTLHTAESEKSKTAPHRQHVAGPGVELARHCGAGPAEAAVVVHLTPTGTPEPLLGAPPLEPGAATPEWLLDAIRRAGPIGVGDRSLVRSAEPEQPPVLIVVLGRGADKSTVVVGYLLFPGDPDPALTSERLAIMAAGLQAADARREIARQAGEIERLRKSATTLVHVADQDRFEGAAIALCNHVAAEWGCERVSLGVTAGHDIRVAAISHTEKIVRKATIVRELEAVMEECLDQDVEIVHPSDSASAPTITRDTSEFASRYGPVAIVSVPLRRDGRPWGVLTLERSPDRAIELADIAALRLLADAVTGQLWIAHRHRRWFGASLAGGVREAGSWVVGPRHTWAKLTAIALAGAAIFFALVPGTYRVQGSSRIEAEQRRVVAAPFDGFLRETLARVGDAVTTGETLARLDTTELLLRLSSLRAEFDGAQREAALAQRERKDAEAQIARARARKSEAEIAFLEHQIEQAALFAPTDGVIVTGDLERVVGAPVSIGDVLFEVAPLDALLVDVFIEEDQIADVAVGSFGSFASASRPDVRIPVRIERIDPIAELREGRNVFRARAALEERPEWLRPGMEGIAKIDAGQRPYPWIWTRRIVNWVRIKLWI